MVHIIGKYVRGGQYVTRCKEKEETLCKRKFSLFHLASHPPQDHQEMNEFSSEPSQNLFSCSCSNSVQRVHFYL